MDETYIAEIAQQAAKLAGCDAADAELMAEAAYAQIKSRLKSGIEPQMCAAELVSAGTLWTLSLLTTAAAGTGVSAYTAGDVHVQRRSSADAVASAAALRSQAESILAPYLLDGTFDFLGVNG